MDNTSQISQQNPHDESLENAHHQETESSVEAVSGETQSASNVLPVPTEVEPQQVAIHQRRRRNRIRPRARSIKDQRRYNNPYEYWTPRNARVLHLMHRHAQLRLEFPEKTFVQIMQLARREWHVIKGGEVVDGVEELGFWEEEAERDLGVVLEHNGWARALRGGEGEGEGEGEGGGEGEGEGGE